MTVGGLWEVLFACVRKHDVNEGFLVTGLLFPLTLPPTVPLWQVALGISFGVVLGKEVFGGTGKKHSQPGVNGTCFPVLCLSGRNVGRRRLDSRRRFHRRDTARRVGHDRSCDWHGIGYRYLVGRVSWHGFPARWARRRRWLVCSEPSCFFVTGIGSWRIMLSVLISGMGILRLAVVRR